MKNNHAILAPILSAIFVACNFNAAVAGPIPVPLHSFTPCVPSSLSFALSFTADQVSVFQASQKKMLRLVLVNNGPDIHDMVFTPFDTTLEIRATSKDGKPLLRDEYAPRGWGNYTGGSTWFPAAHKQEISAPMNVVMPQLNAPGTYSISAVMHLAFRRSGTTTCVESPIRQITVTPG